MCFSNSDHFEPSFVDFFIPEDGLVMTFLKKTVCGNFFLIGSVNLKVLKPIKEKKLDMLLDNFEF